MMRMGKRNKWVAYALAALTSSTIVSMGLLAAPKPKQAQTADQGLWKPTNVQAFFDSFFKRAMTRWHVPGAAFVLVKNGKVVFIKGYGYANLGSKTPVVPDKTVFRVASVSKIFTTTAAMQLVQSGKLRLHENVSHYLTHFKVKDPYPQPVTLAELMTHSAGLDASVIGIAVHRPSQLVPLGTFLARRLPSVVMRPGTVYSYSSFGISLEGYLVQKISGAPFSAYIQKNILRPLDMPDSGFQLTRTMAAHLATGYGYRKGRYVAEPLDYFNIAPAAGLFSTATDMSHFLIAQMEDGRYGNVQILRKATAEEMHRRQFAEDPRIAGRAFGFYERYVNGYRAIGHGGNVRGFASLFMLLPKEHVGFFVVFNRDESRFEGDLIHAFFNHFFPRKDAEPPRPFHLSEAALRKFEGSYRSNPYSRVTLEKLMTLYWQFHITANPDGTLEFHYPHDFKPPGRWTPLGPDYFVCSGGQGRAVFKTDASRNVTHLFTSRDSYEKVPWYGTARFQVLLVEVLMAILLSGCVWWPLYALYRRWRKQPVGQSGPLRWARWVAAALGVLDVFFIVEMLHLLTQMDDWVFVYGVPPDIKALLWIPIVTTALAAAMVWFAIWAWKRRLWTVWGRIHYSLIATTALVFIWFFNYWNLLGFHY